MNKEIKDRLDKLENELKESKNEIHNLKSSVSLKIERGIRKLLSRFSRKQIILGSVIALFSISIIVIAGTVTKTYTFSSGEVVSASKFNTNFDTLFTLVNGNLDDNNISSLSASKITSGTIDGARIDNVSSTAIKYDGIFLYTTVNASAQATKGNLGGRSGADTFCSNANKLKSSITSCSNIRALISTSASDEIRDMPTNYSVPENKPVYNQMGQIIADNLTKLVSGDNLNMHLGGYEDFLNGTAFTYWTGTASGGGLFNNTPPYTCNGFESASSSYYGISHTGSYKKFYSGNQALCNLYKYLMCICY